MTGVAVKTAPTTKHREVEGALRTQIEAGTWLPGERLPGEYELARQHDVAYTTVRQAISNLVQDGVLQRVRGKGTYVVEQAVRTRRTTRHPMSLLIPSAAQESDPYYFPELLASFQQEIAAQELHVRLHSYEVAEAPGALEPVSAIACLMLHEGHLRLVERLRDAGHLVLAINRYAGRRSIPCIWIDDAGGVAEAIDHLVELGHRRIGYINGPADNLDAADRLNGFYNGARQHDLRSVTVVGNGFTEMSGFRAMRELLALAERPTAVVCASDLAAIGAIKAAQEEGLSVPRALSVVGFGDFSVADFITPRLTTVRQSRSILGRTSARALIALADGDRVESDVLNADLIVRESTSRTTQVFGI